MKRVRGYAGIVGAEAYEGPAEGSAVWVRAATDDGREIIDIGPDFARRRELVGQGASRLDSLYYSVERMEAGEAARPVFKRTGRLEGGVPDFDF